MPGRGSSPGADRIPARLLRRELVPGDKALCLVRLKAMLRERPRGRRFPMDSPGRLRLCRRHREGRTLRQHRKGKARPCHSLLVRVVKPVEMLWLRASQIFRGKLVYRVSRQCLAKLHRRDRPVSHCHRASRRCRDSSRPCLVRLRSRVKTASLCHRVSRPCKASLAFQVSRRHLRACFAICRINRPLSGAGRRHKQGSRPSPMLLRQQLCNRPKPS